jgi:hypothetical protein
MNRPHHQRPAPAPTTAEIAELTAWCRKLSRQGHHANPDEVAAYQAAKATLIARITDHPDQELQ